MSCSNVDFAMNQVLKSPDPSALVLLHQVSKSFGHTAALSAVSLAGHPSSIHAITGENGAGKSTLMKLLAGVHEPDQGEIWFKGRQLRLSTPAHARAAGISTVFQELTVLPNLTVAENLCLGREPVRLGFLDHRAIRRSASAVLARTGIDLDPDRLCSSLTVGEQQLLEIAKGLQAEAEVFIFDEPTAPLNRAEVDKLEGLLKALKQSGKLIFYISHRLEEIFRFCDTVSVLKDGRHVTTQPIAALSPERLVTLMVGRELEALFPPRTAADSGKLALTVKNLTVKTGRRPVAFSLHQGEIVGIAGLEGQGQREIIRTLAGAHVSATGDISVYDEHQVASRLEHSLGTARTVRRGVALMPEDRKSEGLYLDLPIQENVWLGPLRKTALWRPATRDQGLIGGLARRMHLHTHPAALVGSLSGGNQQKVMLGRWLAANVRILLVEQPTRGVDVGAKAEIYGLLRQFTLDGGAILVVSGDLPELIGLCDRILVVREGSVAADVRAEDATEEVLLGFALRDPSQSSLQLNNNQRGTA